MEYWMKKTFISSLVASVISLSTGCRIGSQTTDAGTETVYTANTSVKNQGQIGFCWAYAAVAMIESNFKKKTGRDIDLSEEAIGFFHFSEQLKAMMDNNLKFNSNYFNIRETNSVNRGSNALGSKSTLALIERWGLIPESQWSEKFETQFEKDFAMKAIKDQFFKMQEKIRGKQNVVQFNQIFQVLTDSAFVSMPPVDSFNNGSGTMTSTQYAKNVIGFNASDYEDVEIYKSNALTALKPALQRVKATLASGNVVGITISMPSGAARGQRIVANRFVGGIGPYPIGGAHVMVITDFKNKDGVFGPVPDANAEVNKPFDLGFQLRLKNSWGSATGYNEFGQVVQTGFYDMDIGYIADTLDSNGLVIFTFPR
ncbi:hypothetical protein EBR21_02690 [bacterium]|nr:hypothetical protein [bacterium]